MFDIHCPVCGETINADIVEFSVSDLIRITAEQQDAFNNGIAGNYVDVDRAEDIIKTSYLWNYNRFEIEELMSQTDYFRIDSEQIISKLLGKGSVSKLLMVAELFEKEDIDEYNTDLMSIIHAVRRRIPDRVAMGGTVSDTDIYELLRFAVKSYGDVSVKPIFSTRLELVPAPCDDGDVIYSALGTSGKQFNSSKRLCPHCQHELSSMAGKYEEKIVCFMGSPTAGKTAYLTALVSSLRNSAADIDISVSLSDGDEGENSDNAYFSNNCLEPYKYGFAPIKTNSEKFPQISVLISNLKNNKKYLYTFVDMPGEVFAEDGDNGVKNMEIGKILNNRKIIKKADVVWFCIASEQMFDIEKHVMKARLKNEALGSSDDDIENVATIELERLGARAKSFMDVLFETKDDRPPVAVIITKSDQLTDMLVSARRQSSTPEIFNDYFNDVCTNPERTTNGSDLKLIKEKGYSYEQFRSKSMHLNEFAMRYAMPTFRTSFKKNVIDAFGIESEYLVMFSTASMGRQAMNYSVDKMIDVLLSNDETREETEEYVGDGTKKVNKNVEKYLKNMYKEHFPLYTFGIEGPMFWTMAYTHFLDVVKSRPTQFEVVFDRVDSSIPGNDEAIEGNLKMSSIEIKTAQNREAAPKRISIWPFGRR